MTWPWPDRWWRLLSWVPTPPVVSAHPWVPGPPVAPKAPYPPESPDCDESPYDDRDPPVYLEEDV